MILRALCQGLPRFALGLTVLYLLCSNAAAYTVDFEDLPSGATYSNAAPGSFTSGGVVFDLLILKLSPVLDSPAGSVSVIADGGLGSGQGIDIRSVLLGVNLTTTEGLSVLYTDGGLRKNVEINGEFVIHNGELFDLDGDTIGGAMVSVVDDVDTAGGQHSAYGVFTVMGPITSFKIGGQDLVLNDMAVLVPEPAGWVLALLAGVGVLKRKKPWG